MSQFSTTIRNRNGACDDHGNAGRARVNSAVTAMVLLASQLLHPPAFGQPENVDAAPAQATCKLKTVPATSNSSMTTGRMRPARSQPLANYQRSRGIGWKVPKNVKPEDSEIRGLLMIPGGPFVVDLQITIDGEPFRMKREKAIELAEATSKEKSETVTTEENQKGDTPAEGLAEVDNAEEVETVPPTDTNTENNPDESDGGTDDESDVDADNDENEADSPPTDDAPPKTKPTPKSVERLARYMKRQEARVDRNEARWLLAQWTPGPVLLTLRDGFAGERANVAPVLAAIDHDRDGELSVEENAFAEGRLVNADENGDEVVDLSELRAMANARPKGKKRRSPSSPRRLFELITNNTDWDELYYDAADFYALGGSLAAGKCSVSTDFIKRIDGNGNEIWDDDETSRLLEVPADFRLRIRLGAGGESETGVAVEMISSAGSLPEGALQAVDDSITINLGPSYVELSAAQVAASTAIASMDQIAVGAALDGYPLFRLLDQNNDRRLSYRECKLIRPCLTAHDKDQDGKILAHELTAPVRMVVTLGAQVDRVLANPASPAVLPTFGTEDSQTANAPAWFTRMDSNQDGDLSRSEFIGTKEQFTELDQDGDGLLSVKEAEQIEGA